MLLQKENKNGLPDLERPSGLPVVKQNTTAWFIHLSNVTVSSHSRNIKV